MRSPDQGTAAETSSGRHARPTLTENGPASFDARRDRRLRRSSTAGHRILRSVPNLSNRSWPIRLTYVLWLSAALPLAAQTPLESRMDSVFRQYGSTETPGCAVGVAQHGRVLLERAYGMDDLERGVALTPATILEAGSVSKQFTAAAVLLLAREGTIRIATALRYHRATSCSPATVRGVSRACGSPRGGCAICDLIARWSGAESYRTDASGQAKPGTTSSPRSVWSAVTVCSSPSCR